MTICVYGATGWTGRLVVHALQRSGRSIVLCGRRETKLVDFARTLAPQPSVRVASLDDAPALDRAVAGCQILLNCAGPFSDTAYPLLQTSVRNRVAYIDVSGEGSQVGAVYRDWPGPARQAGITVCPAIGAIGALGDWCAAEVSRSLGGRFESIDVIYIQSVRQFFDVSAASALSAASQNFLSRPQSGQEMVRTFVAPAPFGRGGAVRVPGPEEWSIPRVYGGQARTFFSIDPGGSFNPLWLAGLRVGYPFLPILSNLMKSPWGRFHLKLYERLAGPDEALIRGGIVVEGRHQDHTAALAIIAQDPYVASSEVVSVFVDRFLKNPWPAGVLTPSQIVAPQDALDSLSASGAIQVFRFATDGRTQ